MSDPITRQVITNNERADLIEREIKERGLDIDASAALAALRNNPDKDILIVKHYSYAEPLTVYGKSPMEEGNE